MSKDISPFLKHIIAEIDYLLRDSKGLIFDEFIKDETLKRSFVRSLEIIGEATKNLPNDLKKKYPNIPWKEIAGLRDVLIHQYFGVDYKSVWDVVKNKIPILDSQVKAILKAIDSISG